MPEAPTNYDASMNLEGQSILVTGGTGTLGQALVRRMLTGCYGKPERIVVFSRDEARQHAMRLSLMNRSLATDEVIYGSSNGPVVFRIGDIRNPESIAAAIDGVDIVINAAAMKQVPTCEYFPGEADRTNVHGAINLIEAIRRSARPPGTVVGISTDKAVKPVNVMGLTKAMQERCFIAANLEIPATRFVVVRYGNVVASRGSVVPLFISQISRGEPITITDSRMTRFLMTLDDAMDTISHAATHAAAGEIVVPRAPAARIVDLALALAHPQQPTLAVVGVRPGEKLHEVLISEEEMARTRETGDFMTVSPMLPELSPDSGGDRGIEREYSSNDKLLSRENLIDLLLPDGKLGRSLRSHGLN